LIHFYKRSKMAHQIQKDLNMEIESTGGGTQKYEMLHLHPSSPEEEILAKCAKQMESNKKKMLDCLRIVKKLEVIEIHQQNLSRAIEAGMTAVNSQIETQKLIYQHFNSTMILGDTKMEDVFDESEDPLNLNKPIIDKNIEVKEEPIHQIDEVNKGHSDHVEPENYVCDECGYIAEDSTCLKHHIKIQHHSTWKKETRTKVDDYEDPLKIDTLMEREAPSRVKVELEQNSEDVDPSILSDSETFARLSETCRPIYSKCWREFRDLSPHSALFDSRMPQESEMLWFFKMLREEKNYVMTTMCSKASIINNVAKIKYGNQYLGYPKLKAYLKTFIGVDEKKTSDVFTSEELNAFVTSVELSTAYWLVRKALVIVAFLGGLKHQEVMHLDMQNFTSHADGVYVSKRHERSGKMSRFLVPRKGDYEGWADILERYLDMVKQQLLYDSGRVFYTGRGLVLINLPLGKNMVREVPKLVAKFLGKEDPDGFTFHGFRRSAGNYQLLDLFECRCEVEPENDENIHQLPLAASVTHNTVTVVKCNPEV